MYCIILLTHCIDVVSEKCLMMLSDIKHMDLIVSFFSHMFVVHVYNFWICDIKKYTERKLFLMSFVLCVINLEKRFLRVEMAYYFQNYLIFVPAPQLKGKCKSVFVC
jgi:hypothetical protein